LQLRSITAASAERILPSKVIVISYFKVLFFAACAGGLGWGIRGQYGHETGAMIAGVLVGTTLAYQVFPYLPLHRALRAIAALTVGIGLGGSMTYGQTIGLTQDALLIGNQSAWLWGMLGLAIKGGLWIGLGGIWFGMALGSSEYRGRDVAMLMLGCIVLFLIGTWLWNEPFDPSSRRLPRIYFSESWYWKPDGILKPRREVWGGYAMVFIGLLAYTAWRKADGLAVRLGGWGFAGGALGFPLGQCLQSGHAWHREWDQYAWIQSIAPLINWWNLMEISFGAIMAATLGTGLWRNRHRIALRPHGEEQDTAWQPSWVLAWGSLVLHLTLLSWAEFGSVLWVSVLYDQGLVLATLPMIGVFGTKHWPIWVSTIVTVLPIAGKTLRKLSYQEHYLSTTTGWVLCFALPIATAIGMAIWLHRRGEQKSPDATAIGGLLVYAILVYFGLNWLIFYHPWPWEPWTGRTPSAVLFLFFGSSLLAMLPCMPAFRSIHLTAIASKK